MECYNMKRQQPTEPTITINNKPMWYQCMMCYASEYTTDKPLDPPSSNVCKSMVCRMEFALLYSTTEEQFKENLEEIIKLEKGK